MSNEIAGMPLAINADYLKSTGLELPEHLTENAVDDIGKWLARIETGMQWWLGDYWNYRQEHGWGCGPEVSQQLGITYDSVRTFGKVAGQYELGIRIPNLSFGHHQAVAYEDEETRTELLNWCDQNRDEKGRPPAISKLKAERNRRLLDSNEYQETQEAKGEYDVIVIDPPWDMQKIDREVAPMQRGFDYPTMSEQELFNMDIPAADDCHMWVWTTHKFLPSALRCVEWWGFSYVCTFVWHKPGGFQPYNLPQYNCEFALYCRKGAPPFLDTKEFPVCFNAPRGKHSEKPEGFYQLIRRVTGGRRIDIFNRRAISGFDSWGNESGSQ